MRFWDASAIIPLIAEEPSREPMLELLEKDPQMLVWWGTPVEVVSALSRREREGRLGAAEVNASLLVFRHITDGWHEIVPSEPLRRTAERLLRVHPLRAADSLQLSAALMAADRDATTLEFVCLDERLTAAARREGFTVIDG